MTTPPTDLDWLALCLASESNEPREWPYIAWVVRNRQRRQYRGARTVTAVVLDRKQFSYFNTWTADDAAAPEWIYEQAQKGYAGMLWWEARECAEAILAEPFWRAPFNTDVLHYYSPVSMKPKGSAPPWAKTAKRLFTPAGVDESRFVFAAGVR